MANENLHKAKEAKNDEFYTQLNDVAEELRHYKEHFKGKVVFCNCDDPTSSAFWRYFHLNFDHLGLKKLISTHYDKKRPTYKMEYTGGDDNNIEAGVKTPLEGNGDFRNQECIDLLEEADIVVTNPPFSLFREYVSVLEEHNKKFLIIGNPNAVTYKEFFPLLKENKVWIGAKPWSSEMYFGVPEEQADYLVKNKKEGSAYVIRNGQILGRAATLWFTNLDIKKRHEKLILWKNYTPAEFPQYDNYDAINVDKVSNIPCDYCESWEVTEDEFKNFSADEWEVTRTGERDGKKSFFIIPAANTELRKLLHEHTAGYKDAIESEIFKNINKNISNNGLPSGRRAAGRQKKGIVTEPLALQLHTLTVIMPPSLKSSAWTDTLKITQNTDIDLQSETKKSTQGLLSERYCNGIAGVPITFLDKYNPEQFEIVNANDYRKTENVPVKPHGLIKDKDASITLSESKKEMQKSIDKKDSKNIIAKSRAEQSRAEQSRAEQSRAEQSRAETDCLRTNLHQEEAMNCSHLEATDGISPENGNMQGFLSGRYCNGVFGVPITYLDKYNPEQFEIIGMLQSSTDEQAGIPNLRFYNNFREMRQDMSYTGASGGKANGNPVIKEKPKKGNFLYNEKTGEYVHSVYARIVIRRKL